MFIYDALLEALRSGETAIPAGEFRVKFAAMCKLNYDTNCTPLQVEFEVRSDKCNSNTLLHSSRRKVIEAVICK